MASFYRCYFKCSAGRRRTLCEGRKRGATVTMSIWCFAMQRTTWIAFKRHILQQCIWICSEGPRSNDPSQHPSSAPAVYVTYKSVCSQRLSLTVQIHTQEHVRQTPKGRSINKHSSTTVLFPVNKPSKLVPYRMYMACRLQKEGDDDMLFPCTRPLTARS